MTSPLTDPKAERITIRLPAELARRLELAAQGNSVTRAAATRAAIEAYVAATAHRDGHGATQ